MVDQALDFAIGKANPLAQPRGGGFGDRADGRVAHFAGAGLMNGPLAVLHPRKAERIRNHPPPGPVEEIR